MNGDLLGEEVIAAMDAVTSGIVEGDTQETIESKLRAYRVSMMKAMCGAFVQHIQTNAQVTANVTVVSVSGVTTGPGVSGPGTGSATGTIT